jgi:hypothetical protein
LPIFEGLRRRQAAIIFAFALLSAADFQLSPLQPLRCARLRQHYLLRHFLSDGHAITPLIIFRLYAISSFSRQPITLLSTAATLIVDDYCFSLATTFHG